jgi:hypothetical protein
VAGATGTAGAIERTSKRPKAKCEGPGENSPGPFRVGPSWSAPFYVVASAYPVWGHDAPVVTMRSIIALHTAPSIPGGLRFCLSDLVRVKGVPAARGRHDFGLDLGEQTLNASAGCFMEVEATPPGLFLGTPHAIAKKHAFVRIATGRRGALSIAH